MAKNRPAPDDLDLYFGMTETPAPAPTPVPPAPKPKRKRSAPPEPEEPVVAPPYWESLPKPGQWPDQVPILTVDDLIRGSWHGDGSKEGKHDLGGWLETAFDCNHKLGYQANPLYARAYDTLRKVLIERGVPMAEKGLFEICDDKEVPLDLLAAAFNEAMARLGYDIPEDKRRNRRK